MKKITIIGAGLSGALIAYNFRKNKIDHQLIDKGRGAGGRFSTRRTPTSFLNHGSQYFPRNRHESDDWFISWRHDKLITETENGWKINGKSSDLIKSLLLDSELILYEKVISLSYLEHENQFNIKTQSGASFNSEKIILTCPAQQSLDLTSRYLNEKQATMLKSVRYKKQLILFTKKRLPVYSSITPQYEIRSCSDQSMLRFDPETSEFLFEKPDTEIIIELLKLVSSIDIKLGPHDVDLKKWRYAYSNYALSSPYIQADKLPLYIVGDGFCSDFRYGAERALESSFSLLREIFSQEY